MTGGNINYSMFYLENQFNESTKTLFFKTDFFYLFTGVNMLWPATRAKMDDSTFRPEYEKNHGLTERMFQNYFRKLYNDWRLNEPNKLFKYLSLDSLQQKDSLSYYAIKEKEPCLKQYFLTVSDILVMITYGANGNPGFKGKKSDDEGG